jgi:hypothetical protein
MKSEFFWRKQKWLWQKFNIPLTFWGFTAWTGLASGAMWSQTRRDLWKKNGLGSQSERQRRRKKFKRKLLKILWWDDDHISDEDIFLVDSKIRVILELISMMENSIDVARFIFFSIRKNFYDVVLTWFISNFLEHAKAFFTK